MKQGIQKWNSKFRRVWREQPSNYSTMSQGEIQRGVNRCSDVKQHKYKLFCTSNRVNQHPGSSYRIEIYKHAHHSLKYKLIHHVNVYLDIPWKFIKSILLYHIERHKNPPLKWNPSKIMEDSSQKIEKYCKLFNWILKSHVTSMFYDAFWKAQGAPKAQRYLRA